MASKRAPNHGARTGDKPLARSPAPAPGAPRPSFVRYVPWMELALGLVLVAVLVVLHVTFLRHVGGLWRDEVQIVNLGNMPTLAEMWDKNEHDSFPIAWHLVIRGWTKLGLGQSDSSLRCLGTLIGLGIVAMLWWVVRQFGGRVPLVAMAMFSFSPTVIWFADSMRGYGWGTLTMLFLFGAFWRMVEKPTRGRIALALFAAVLAVQSMYFNAVLLFALGTGGAGVALWRRDWKLLAIIAGVGILAALSLIPYYDPLSRQGRWNAIVKSPVGLRFLFDMFTQAITLNGDFMFWLWAAVPVVVLLACGWRALALRKNPSMPRKELVAYLPLLLIVGSLSYLFLLVRSQLPTQIWYYIGIMAFLSVTLDLAIDLAVAGHWIGRCARMAAAAALAAVLVPTVWPQMHYRLTNVDLVAKKLECLAAPEDLIVFVRWWPGVSFNRYYHGPAPWTSIPELSDMTVQRFDLLKEKMSENEPIEHLKERIKSTLSSGHTLWLIGGFSPLPKDPRYEHIPPLPQGPLSQEPYLMVWSWQIERLLLEHADVRTFHPVDVPTPTPVLGTEGIPHDKGLFVYECVPVYEVSGWR